MKQTTKLYLTIDAPLQHVATVVETDVQDGQPYVILNESVLHPQGGGQRADQGRIDGAPIQQVAHGPNDTVMVFHEHGVGFVVGQKVEITVDPMSRRINSALHSSGHLLAHVVETLQPNVRAVRAHHWPAEASVSFQGLVTGDVNVVQTSIEAMLRDMIAASLPIAIVGDPFVNRAIQIGSFMPVPCGGTHLRNTRELAEITLRKVKVKKAELRVSYDVAPLSQPEPPQ